MGIGELAVRISLKLAGPKGRAEALAKEPSAIRYIRKPSEAEQMIAVENHPLYIQFIANPTLAVQSNAVNQNRSAIQYIKNPAPEVEMLAKLLE